MTSRTWTATCLPCSAQAGGNTTEFQTFYYHANYLGSVSALTWWDAGAGQEKVVERYQYNAYGWLVVTHWGSDRVFGTSDDASQPASLVGNPYGFTARALDSETGLMYYRARYYSPLFGRFISRDPIGYADGMNLYAAYFVPNAPPIRGRRNQTRWLRLHRLRPAQRRPKRDRQQRRREYLQR